MRNELKNADYARLTEMLNENPSASIELFPGIDLEIVSVSPVLVAVDRSGYCISGEVSFQQPIGLEVYDDLKLDDEMQRSFVVNFRNIKLLKAVTEANELESNLNKCLKILERIVNHTCSMLDKQVEQAFTLNSEWLDRQFDLILKKEEWEKRGEISRPFGIIHAKSLKDAKERAGDLIPLYKEHDKTYLFDAKRVYFLLPHSFVVNLLWSQRKDSTISDETS